MTRLSDRDLDQLQAKPRPKGRLPWLPDEMNAETLRAWLTLAFRPPPGWSVAGVERAGREETDPCALIVQNGREAKRFRFGQQRKLASAPRQAAMAVSDGWLAVPHLTAGEVEDVWAALCTLGRVLSEHDEVDEMREAIESMLPSTMPLPGYSLVPDGRHEALMAIKQAGEFTKPDALQLGRGADDRYQRRPLRFVDSQTGEQWLRCGETATYLRWVLGIEPLSHATLRARLREIGVVGREFEDYRPPHPKAKLYQLTEALIESVDGGQG
jgi:hypothetical protein